MTDRSEHVRGPGRPPPAAVSIAEARAALERARRHDAAALDGSAHVEPCTPEHPCPTLDRIHVALFGECHVALPAEEPPHVA